MIYPSLHSDHVIIIPAGDVPKRLKGPVSKTGRRASVRGFEPLRLRHFAECSAFAEFFYFSKRKKLFFLIYRKTADKTSDKQQNNMIGNQRTDPGNAALEENRTQCPFCAKFLADGRNSTNAWCIQKTEDQ